MTENLQPHIQVTSFREQDVWLSLTSSNQASAFCLNCHRPLRLWPEKKWKILERARFLSYFNSAGMKHDKSWQVRLTKTCRWHVLGAESDFRRRRSTDFFRCPTPSVERLRRLSSPVPGEKQIFPSEKCGKAALTCDSKAITKLPKKEELNGQKVPVS